jgi:hypothetical protein
MGSFYIKQYYKILELKINNHECHGIIGQKFGLYRPTYVLITDVIYLNIFW